MSFAKIVKMSKSSTSSRAWDKKVKKQFKDFTTLLDNAAIILKSKYKKQLGVQSLVRSVLPVGSAELVSLCILITLKDFYKKYL